MSDETKSALADYNAKKIDKVDAAREALLRYRSRSLEAALTYRDLIDTFEAAIRAESEATVAALREAAQAWLDADAEPVLNAWDSDHVAHRVRDAKAAVRAALAATPEAAMTDKVDVLTQAIDEANGNSGWTLSEIDLLRQVAAIQKRLPLAAFRAEPEATVAALREAGGRGLSARCTCRHRRTAGQQ